MLSSTYVGPALTLLFFLYLLKRIFRHIEISRFIKANGCEPLYQNPQSDRIIGLSHIREQRNALKTKTLFATSVKRYEKNGLTWESAALGRKMVNTIDPENIRAILATNFSSFGLGHRGAFLPLLGRGIFTSDGKAWEHSRALIRPNFTKLLLSDLSIFETHISALISRIPRDFSTIDLQPLFFMLTLDTSTQFLFGTSVRSLHTKLGSKELDFVEAFDYAQHQILLQQSGGPVARLLGRFDRKNRESIKTVHAFVDTFVAKVLAEKKEKEDAEKRGSLDEEKGNERYTFLGELAKETSDPKELRDELLNVLLAGRDTTASLLSNTFNVISKRQDVWKKLVEEIDTTLGGRTPDYATLRDMKYLKWVLNESLRLYPVVPINSRLATTDTLLPRGGGPSRLSPIFIPKGQIVYYSPFAMHRNTTIYGPDAHTFNPDRWATIRVGWNYLPFNGGPRICPGQHFALVSASYYIVRIVQCFEGLESREEGTGEWVEQVGLTLASGNGAKVGLRVREGM